MGRKKNCVASAQNFFLILSNGWINVLMGIINQGVWTVPPIATIQRTEKEFENQ